MKRLFFMKAKPIFIFNLKKFQRNIMLCCCFGLILLCLTITAPQVQAPNMGENISAAQLQTLSEVLYLDLNQATLEELMLLDGIGEKKAQAIITYRQTNGNFTSIEEVKNVSGIGDKTYETIKEYIFVK